jgi:NADH-quinone oxidoreductase subunit N
VTTYFAIVPKIAYLGVLMKLGGGDPIMIAGLISILVGSIGAINQTKIKRMLAYSAIGHVGFMLLGIGIATYTSIQATLIYMIIYIVMTANSFIIVLNQGILKIAELRGLSRRNGILGMTMGLGLMSIAGVPPLSGFYNKYLVIQSAVDQNLITYALIAILLSVISSFYYVRIIIYMFFVDQAEITVKTERVSTSMAIILGITTYIILTIMLYPSVLMEITYPRIF